MCMTFILIIEWWNIWLKSIKKELKLCNITLIWEIIYDSKEDTKMNI